MTETRDPALDAPERLVLPMQTRREVRLMAETADPETRTIEMVWSTGAPVRRRDLRSSTIYEEILSLDPAHVDLTRLNSGAPLLNAHGAFDLDDVIGVVESAWIAREGESFVGRARVRFSDREEVTPIWRDVATGIIRNVSVGYDVRAYEVMDEAGPVPVWRAIDWQPLELSAVPIGADGAAGFRSGGEPSPCRLVRSSSDPATKEPPMIEPTDVIPPADAEPDSFPAASEPLPPVAPERPAPPSEDALQRARSEERGRIAQIYDAARKLQVEIGVADDLVQRGVPLPEARAALIDASASRDAAVATRPHIRMGTLDEGETRRAAIADALLNRFDPVRYDLPEPARDWRGLSLLEMARSLLEAEGTRVRGLSRDELATRALHTTSDFPAILANVANKTLRDAYDTAPRTFSVVARRTTVPDFKPVYRLQLGEAPQFEKVNEAGEFKRGTIGEAKESYRVVPWGRIVGITRQVLVNDDLDAFTRVPALFGTSAATLESDVVWGLITANEAMADGKALFHAAHGNLAAAGSALEVTTLAKARTAMARQTGLDGKTILNVRPAFLVVPTSLELAAEQLLAQNLVPAKTGDVVPTSLRSLSVISEPRLDTASGPVPWYLMASPSAIDTLEYAYLEGQDGVAIETRMGFDVDGIEIRARLDFGAKAIDWRGLYKNPGVALS